MANNNKPKAQVTPTVSPVVVSDDEAKKNAAEAAAKEDENVTSQGEDVDGRRPAESEKPAAVNQPTVPEPIAVAPPEADKDGGQGELKDKSGMKYYKNMAHAGASVVVRDKDGKETGETVSFTQFYDTWKGDQIRVGYLATDNKEVQEVLENDYNVEEINFSEYKTVLRGDGKKNQPLNRVPTVAV